MHAEIYSSDLDDIPVLEEMFSINKTVNPINTYFVVTPSVVLVSTPTKVIKKRRKIRCRKKLATIKISELDTIDSARFLSINNLEN